MRPCPTVTLRAAPWAPTPLRRASRCPRPQRGILATDVRTPSLFAEPHRIIDVDEASELLTAVMTDSDAKEMRDRLASKRRFVWLKREITKQREQIHRLGFPASASCPRTSASIPTAPRFPTSSATSTSTTRASPASKVARPRGLADLHLAGLATDRLQKPIELAVDPARPARDARRARRGAQPVQGDCGRGRADRRADRGGDLHGLGAGLRFQQSARGARPDPHQPAHHRRVRDGLDLQSAHPRDGARFGKISLKSSFDARGG